MSFPLTILRHGNRQVLQPDGEHRVGQRAPASGEDSMPNSAMKSVMLGSLADGAKAAVSTAMLPGTLKWFTSR